ncbi:MAG TPA: MBL fold metallo-hydrolase [Bryobacteraceae bacterium]|nr:MBL fold metallo-hydrolase [Bryobacteraceae bacterium]
MKWIVFLAAVGAWAFSSEHSELFNTDVGPVNITPIHNASLLIEGAGRVLYVDPVGESTHKAGPKADIILITSDKPDHLDPAAIAHISRKNTAIVAPAGPASKLPHSTAIANGETVRSSEIVIEATPSFHTAADRGQANGYVLTYPGLRIYISGDTGVFPEMKAIKNIDVAFFALGPDGMSVDDAAKAVRLIKPKTLFPYRVLEGNADDLRKQLSAPGTEVRVRKWN